MRYADEYGFYELNPFPGCNQVVVSNHAFIHTFYRGQGNGYRQHQALLAEARRLGYSYIICTVQKQNSKEISILEGAYADRFIETVSNFYAALLVRQEPLGEEFARVLHDNLWDLYER